MHDLSDMRYFSYWYDSPLPIVYVFEIGEDGLPTALEREERYDWRPLTMPLYRCGCGNDFAAWDEAKGHLQLYDWERANAPA